MIKGAKLNPYTKIINAVINDCEGKIKTQAAFNRYSHCTKIVWNDFEQR
ncbi:MAG: hypothetical protein ACI8UC_001496 [Psychromonas sp.]